MDLKRLISKNKTLFSVVLLLIVSALIYLPLVQHFGYYNDDWYEIYDVFTRGPGIFHEIFASDRPGRAYLMIFLFKLFGLNPLYYNLSAFIFRFLGALSLWWSLRMLWPKQQTMTYLAALFFVIYPGFLSQPNAIDYQSHIVGLFFAMFSIALTIRSILTPQRISRIFLAVASVITGWIYLSQMEYFLGFEFTRIIFIFILSASTTRKDQLAKVFRSWVPFIIIPAGFLVWRIFFFESARRATDPGAQVAQLFSYPLTGPWWFIYLFQDTINILVVAWGLPLYDLAFQMRLRDMLTGMGIAILTIPLALLGMIWLEGVSGADGSDETSPKWYKSALCAGLLSIVGGLLPVIAANRHIMFPDYSRYTLVGLVGVGLVIATFVAGFSSRRMKMLFVGLLVLIATLTHYANAVKATTETDSLRNFWWQVSWRAPDIKDGTTLIASYPASAIQEDYFVWGPANLIYRPEKESTIPVEIKIPAAVLNEDIVLNVITGKGDEKSDRRGNQSDRDFNNVLVITQPAQNVCVRIIDGNRPELSRLDDPMIRLIAPYSHIDNVLFGESRYTPPVEIFGQEPLRDWCFYYQKAAFARQKEDWSAIASLGKQALGNGFYPSDIVEWMPFLEAYAVLGNEKEIRRLVPIINQDHSIRLQACTILSALLKAQATLDTRIYTIIQSSFCE